jgi:hypothetical protein
LLYLLVKKYWSSVLPFFFCFDISQKPNVS